MVAAHGIFAPKGFDIRDEHESLISWGRRDSRTQHLLFVPRRGRTARASVTPITSLRKDAGPVTIRTTGRRRWPLAMRTGSSCPCGFSLHRPGAFRNLLTHWKPYVGR